MEKQYKTTKTTVSLINYHFVFCPRYRRRIFDNKAVDIRFKELIAELSKEKDWPILAIETDSDHCHLFISVQPIYSPSDVMRIVKGKTSWTIRNEFKHLNKMPSLWTRSYFCSTAGSVSSETIKQYVENQRKTY